MVMLVVLIVCGVIDFWVDWSRYSELRELKG